MNKVKYDYLIVGCGLYGSLFTYMAKQSGKKCIVIDKRNHIGGNLYCNTIEDINVHKYGAHIFHTSNKEVWDFVNSIVPFNRFTNSPLAKFKDRLFNLPFNMNTFYQLWGVKTPIEAMAVIEEQRKELEGVSPSNLEEQAISLVGRDVYEMLIKGYTEKQWGRNATELPPFIIKRIPVRFVYDNNYFNDDYQGIPIGGYNKLIDGLIRDVEVCLDTDFFKDRQKWMNISEKVVFTGMIDEFFDYCYGNLEYRTLSFKNELLDIKNFQGNAVINYTEAEIAYTRIIEHKHFEFGSQNKTVITYEYPAEWKKGEEPYYPVNDAINMNKYKLYEKLASKEDKVIFGGRLAEYKYYDMHQIVERVINLFRK